jgi:ATP-dependent Clp protease protease subunit
MNEGHIWIDDVIDQYTYDNIKNQLATHAKAASITLHIGSPGGSVRAGNKIFHLLKNSGKTINPIVEGQAESMASYLALLGKYTNGKSKICNPSTYMIHLPQNEVAGTADDLVNGANELIAIQNEMAEAYSFATGIPREKTLEMMKVTTRLNAQQAKELGFIDELIGSYSEAVASGQTIKKTMEKEKGIINKIKEIIGLSEPKGQDFKTKDGKMLSVSEDGKTATIDGQPASGSYVLEDGKTVICENGTVTSIQEAPAAAQATPPPPAQQPAPVQAPPVIPTAPVQTAEQRLAAIEAEFNTLKAAKESSDKAKAEAEAAKLEAEKKSAESITALGKIKTEMENLKDEPVGDQSAPFVGSQPITPSAIGKKTGPEAMSLMASRTFIADHMPWLERYYSKGKYSDGTDFMSYRSNGPNAVSILETNFNYTWNGILTTDLFFKPSLDSPALADFFTIDLGASHKKTYNLINPISKVLKPYTGCGGTPAGNRQLITSKAMQLKPFQMYESWCMDDFTGQLTGIYNLLAQEWLKTGNAKFDPAGTPINTIIMDSLKDSLRRDIFRRVFFAAGNSSSADYNQIDGFWDRNIDNAGASNYCVYKYGSNLGIGTLATDAAATYFKGIYENSSRLLKQEAIDKDKSTFWVTRSIWENYYAYLVGVGAVTEQAYSDFRSGAKTLEFRGHPVRPITIWDEDLADASNPLFAVTRHLIVFTQKKNHILGLENAADLEKIESWFEMKDQKRYYRSNMTMGYLDLHCDLTTISY